MGKSKKRLNFADYQLALSKYLKKNLSLDTIHPATNEERYIELQHSLKIAIAYAFGSQVRLYHSSKHILKIRKNSTDLAKFEYYPNAVIDFWAISNYSNGPDLDHWTFLPMYKVLNAIRNYQPEPGSEIYLTNDYDWRGNLNSTEFYWKGDKIRDRNHIPASIDNFETLKGKTPISTAIIKKTTQSFWIFQGNPDQFDIDSYLKNFHKITWSVRQSKNEIHQGDNVLIWKSGVGGGVIAECVVTEEPSALIPEDAPELWRTDQNEHQGELRCSLDVKSSYVDRPISRDIVKVTLPDLSIIKFSNSTNFEVSKLEYETILKLKNTGDVMLELEKIYQALKRAQLCMEYDFLKRFVASLLTKPFVIFTGLSGSGKTRLAQAFAQWICAEEKQYKIIPVGADWTNREPLLGFPNALEIGKYVKPDNGVLDLLLEATKMENAEKPYFLILDEMNLSHVERYFADFLSAMESGETIPLHSDGLEWKTTDGNWKEGIPDKITVPQNLFIIGTVNIDETTYMFSPKVLDRAGVLEFRITEEEMQKYLTNPVKPDLESIKGAGGEMAANFLKKALQDYTDFNNQEKITECLNKFFTELKKASAEFGYRSASEIFRFAAIMPTVSKDITTDEIIDAAVIQKLLPKLHGSRRKLEPVLKILAGLCLNDASKAVEILNEKKSDYTGDPRVQLPLSFEKISRMYHRALNDGFTSFAEA